MHRQPAGCVQRTECSSFHSAPPMKEGRGSTEEEIKCPTWSEATLGLVEASNTQVKGHWVGGIAITVSCNGAGSSCNHPYLDNEHSTDICLTSTHWKGQTYLAWIVPPSCTRCWTFHFQPVPVVFIASICKMLIHLHDCLDIGRRRSSNVMSSQFADSCVSNSILRSG